MCKEKLDAINKQLEEVKKSIKEYWDETRDQRRELIKERAGGSMTDNERDALILFIRDHHSSPCRQQAEEIEGEFLTMRLADPDL